MHSADMRIAISVTTGSSGLTNSTDSNPSNKLLTSNDQYNTYSSTSHPSSTNVSGVLKLSTNDYVSFWAGSSRDTSWGIKEWGTYVSISLVNTY